MVEPRSIAVLRLSSLGDIVHTLPALTALRRSFPAARLTWITEKAGVALLENVDGIDELAVFDFRRRRGADRPAFLRDFRRRFHGRFDCILDFQGLIKSAVLARLLGGYTVGFARPNLREKAAALFYHHRVGVFPEADHVIHKNLHLLRFFGITGAGVEYSLRPPPASAGWEEYCRTAGWMERRPVLLNVGGGWPTKLLSAEQWTTLCRRLDGRFPLALLWGNEAERLTAEAVAASAPGVRVLPFLTFTDLIRLLGRAALLVSGDTLPLHLADAVGTPSVGVFGPTSPRRNGSLLPASRAVYSGCDYGFCYKRKCDTISCMRKIHEDAIQEAIETIYAQCQ